MISQLNGLVPKAGSKNLEHRTNKRMAYALQKKNKKSLRYEAEKPSHKIIRLYIVIKQG